VAGPELVRSLIRAIRLRHRIRLVYTRQADEVTTLHEVAPLDIRPGDTRRTQDVLYLLAWCYAEARPEMHLVRRIDRVVELEPEFELAEILKNWPTEKWPIPDDWVVSRLT
jgi:predicted DNA-binding transcriptional regulator YafY